jgi:peptide deformylase
MSKKNKLNKSETVKTPFGEFGLSSSHRIVLRLVHKVKYRGAKKILTNRSRRGLVSMTTKCTSVNFNDAADIRLCEKIVNDLLKTANKNYSRCLGLSANQIGYSKRIFVVRNERGGKFIPIINPVAVGRSGGMKTLGERCLSRVDKKKKKNLSPAIQVRRHKNILLEYHDVILGGTNRAEFKGVLARAINHEMDHLNGVLV